MPSAIHRTLLAAALAGAVGSFATGAAAGEPDANPVFAALAPVDAARLEGTRGRGVVQESTFTASATDTNITAGDNSIAAGAFSDSQVFAAVVQNTGSFVSVQNLMTVNVNISD